MIIKTFNFVLHAQVIICPTGINRTLYPRNDFFEGCILRPIFLVLPILIRHELTCGLEEPGIKPLTFSTTVVEQHPPTIFIPEKINKKRIHYI